MDEPLVTIRRQGSVAVLSLEAEREAFVAQVQTQEALEGIEHFLGRNAV